MSLALTRDKQCGFALEVTPGTKKTLTAADYGLEFTDITFTATPENIENQVYKGSISASPIRIGKIPGSITLSGEFKNSGVANTEAKLLKLLRLCGNTVSPVFAMTISAPTGTFKKVAEIVTGGSSGAKARIVDVNGTTLYVIVISGTFTADETITGSSSAATATYESISSTGSGFAAIPTTGYDVAGTFVGYDAGLLKEVYGAAGTMTLELSTDSVAKWSATITGIADAETWGSIASKVTGISYESIAPLVVNAADMLIDGTVTPITSQMTFDIGNTVSLVKDLNSETWYRQAAITSRTSVGTLVISQPEPSEYDVFEKLFSGASGTLEYTIGGATAGTGIKMIIPALQWTGSTNGDDNGFQNNSLPLRANGNDDEYAIWFR